LVEEEGRQNTNTANDHPEILPGIFDVAEFKKDYALSKDLLPSSSPR
jgi:hypothetical protein